MTVVAVFSSVYLLVPAATGGILVFVHVVDRKRRREAAT